MNNGFYKLELFNEHGESIKLNISNESATYDWVDVFKTILTWATYNHSNINELFCNHDDCEIVKELRDELRKLEEREIEVKEVSKKRIRKIV